ncbi:hypothetical protein EVAR_56300_1 [Eumeta japonica]|uniref:Uncharacterized protein n=1 Tax=Eumeta variegata TaxID=151549 RepID=A0A4C1Z2S2_EUMVA|nr:hypothetical protein EVAR_56300_1 [Eumeta japonica]
MELLTEGQSTATYPNRDNKSTTSAIVPSVFVVCQNSQAPDDGSRYIGLIFLGGDDKFHRQRIKSGRIHSAAAAGGGRRRGDELYTPWARRIAPAL